MSNLARARVGPHTWDDFIALDEDDLRELIDGELVEVEVPARIHEWIVGELFFHVKSFTRRRGGAAYPSGYKVRITERRGVMPDIQMYREGNEPVEQQQGLVRGRPDLVIEVVSPSSQRYDRTVKLGYYAALEIPEYWIVDPSTKTVERLVWTRKKGYVVRETLRGDAIFCPPGLDGVEIRLAELWSEKRPKNVAAKPKRKR
jgi:Uma2 family endonuclease